MSSQASGSDRLEVIRHAVEAGTYEVESVDVADAILRNWRMADLVDEFASAQAEDSAAAASDAAKR